MARSLAEIIAEKKAQRASALSSISEDQNFPTEVLPFEKGEEKEEENETLNASQKLACELTVAGKTFCLVGAAGTGKTFTTTQIAKSLLSQNILGTHTFRIQGTGERVEAPSIAFVAFIKTAVENMKRAINSDQELASYLQYNVTTIHNLLEYAPNTYYDEEGKERFRFEPRRTAGNKLEITHLVIEESSQVGAETLWKELYAALNPGVQIIFLGDINQLPPVFGTPILCYGLVQLPVVELTKVYRQKEGSEIVENAHRILRGEMPISGGAYRIISTPERHKAETLSIILSKAFPKWMEAGMYDPEKDMILSPFNVQELGTEALNTLIAQHLTNVRQLEVHEVKVGINKHYLSIGDRVMVNKKEARIVGIEENRAYVGPDPRPPSKTLGRNGIDLSILHSDFTIPNSYQSLSIEDIRAAREATFERLAQASHRITVETVDEELITLTSLDDLNPKNFSLGYALTVHKSQGSEWRNVFFILHHSHATMGYRELLYTGTTRARENLFMIAQPETLKKAIATQRLAGNSIEEKIQFFNSKIAFEKDIRSYK